jgi:hypothetical protein
MSAKVKFSERQGEEKNVVSAASLPDIAVETLLFGRDRCRYVGRDVTLCKYPVNSKAS